MSICCFSGDQTHNPGMCPEWESNQCPAWCDGANPLSHTGQESAHLYIQESSGTRREPLIPDTKHQQLSPSPHQLPTIHLAPQLANETSWTILSHNCLRLPSISSSNCVTGKKTNLECFVQPALLLRIPSG